MTEQSGAIRLTDKKRKNHKGLVVPILIVLILAVALISLGTGSAGLSYKEMLRTLIGRGTNRSEIIVYGNRMPRVLTALLAGAVLGMGGAVMQSVLRNPLASASTLGVSQGASFGATIAIILLGAGTQNPGAGEAAISFNNLYLVTVCAFFGGAVSTLIILLLSRVKKLGSASIVLVGVALSALFSGGTTLVQYFADDVQVAAVVFWTFGDLGRTNSNEVAALALICALSFVFFILNAWNYNALNSGVHTASSLGVNVSLLIYGSMLVATLIASVAVALIGIISFVGLIAPHIMRRFVGNDYRYLVPASALSGGLLLLLADLLCRVVVSPIVLPIGAVTSFVGGPLYLWLIFRANQSVSL